MWTVVEVDGGGFLYVDRLSKYAQHDFSAPLDEADIDAALNTRDIVERAMSLLGLGEYHARIWRGSPSPTAAEAGLRVQEVGSSRSFRLLESRLERLFAHIEPVSAHDDVYSYELRHLLILAATDVEAAWKAIMVAQGAKPINKHFNRADYVKLVAPLRLEEWEVKLASAPDYPALRPFAGWSGTGNPLPWYDDYNAVKHDREAQLASARFASVVLAMAASLVMHVAQFGPDSADIGGEFVITQQPEWGLEERYVDPFFVDRRDGSPLGTWTRAKLPL